MSAKSDNGRHAKKAKIELRELALSMVPRASVFDAFSGLGEMYMAVWHRADRYLGCDAREWSPAEPHRRLVADNRAALRCLDLAAFNVFDLDAYGSPWEQAAIVATRRRWAPGERGAVLLTDGSDMKLRFGGRLPASIAWYVGTSHASSGAQTAETMQAFLLSAWCERAGVKPLRCARAQGRSGDAGNLVMRYTALVFEGAAQPSTGSET